MDVIMNGKYNHTLDPKGRVSIPSQLRKKLGDAFYITVSSEDCLVGYTAEGWKKFNRWLDKADDDIAATYRGYSADCVIDAQGRAFIPLELREYAALETNVVIRGNGDKMEIWKAETFEERQKVTASRDRLAEYKKVLQEIKERDSE